jgi:hypothetical protein
VLLDENVHTCLLYCTCAHMCGVLQYTAHLACILECFAVVLQAGLRGVDSRHSADAHQYNTAPRDTQGRYTCGLIRTQYSW